MRLGRLQSTQIPQKIAQYDVRRLLLRLFFQVFSGVVDGGLPVARGTLENRQLQVDVQVECIFFQGRFVLYLGFVQLTGRLEHARQLVVPVGVTPELSLQPQKSDQLVLLTRQSIVHLFQGRLILG